MLRASHVLVLSSIVGLALGACRSNFESCDPGTLECECLDGDLCGDNLMCAGGLCVSADGETGESGGGETLESSSTSTGDGDGDASTGDGDGDGSTGDGDGSTGDGDGSTGDGDGSTGDGDGDGSTGDGDGDGSSGDGDGDGSSGDGDGDGDPCSQCNELQYCDVNECVDPAVVVYLNFDAEGTFNYTVGASDGAATNTHGAHADLSGTLNGYGTGFKRTETINRIREDFMSFLPDASIAGANGLLLVEERPVSGEYEMVVATPDIPTEWVGTGMLGIGDSVDCGNAAHNNIYFAFMSVDDQYSAQIHGNVFSSAVGRVLGLERVSTAGSVMYWQAVDDTDAVFNDACEPVQITPAWCGSFHENFCQIDHQNSVSELRAHVNQF